MLPALREFIEKEDNLYLVIFLVKGLKTFRECFSFSQFKG